MPAASSAAAAIRYRAVCTVLVVSVVNALSEWLTADVYKDGRHYKQTYSIGIPTSEVEDIGPSQEAGYSYKVPAR